jgi:hypothetical protein
LTLSHCPEIGFGRPEGHRRVMEWMYVSTFPLPRQELEVSEQLHAPATVPSGKEHWLPIGYEACCAPVSECEPKLEEGTFRRQFRIVTP